MGSTGGNTDEWPVHSVRLSPFVMMESEVTRAQYLQVMGSDPSGLDGCAECPVESVSWFDAVAFANKLSEAQGLRPAYRISGESVSWDQSANGWRLPTEAEWEYAARGGASFVYAGSDDATSVGWFDTNATRTMPVCGRQRNGYGLCDMSGNVWEWVWDWYDFYAPREQDDPSGPQSGEYRVFRSGSWDNGPRGLHATTREAATPDTRYVSLGFRLARSSP